MAHPITRKARAIQLAVAVVCTIVFFVGLIFLILWLSLRPHTPKFHIEDFSISVPSQPNELEIARITFNVTVHNGNHRIGILYDSLTGSVYYKDQWVGSTHLLDPFYQGPKKTTLVYHAVPVTALMVNSQRWMEFVNDRAKGSVDFRLELISTVRYRTKLWDTKRHRIHPNCIVPVGQDGLILPSYKHRKCTA
ncbi:NDR1/HIN1-like protein 10 [Ricinus communis]|uniref:Signal transducer, putative n=1 Tax=Ricinus communis TaxID=3988 RepID=B9RXS3_RICCO|nr:NDR1/HIN1-like protein 10 [Ricinus communis]EEF43929.1 signal transducer, putative [Ricinus communis]|eukprot:XP_002518542.1 NDR1/HIN1-like protein 10 [Ricinus communis]